LFAGGGLACRCPYFFLSSNKAEQAYWPQVMMHLLQVPLIYLHLVRAAACPHESKSQRFNADPLTVLPPTLCWSSGSCVGDVRQQKRPVLF
jgi:hypothetical protein